MGAVARKAVVQDVGRQVAEEASEHRHPFAFGAKPSWDSENMPLGGLCNEISAHARQTTVVGFKIEV